MHKFVSWNNLAALFRRQVFSLFPAADDCLLCVAPKSLWIYHDNKLGYWFHCKSCRKAGTLLELASLALKKSLVETLKELQAHGTYFPAEQLQLENIEKYERKFTTKKLYLDHLLEAGQTRLLKQEASQLLQELRIKTTGERKRLEIGPAKLFGINTAEEVAKIVRAIKGKDLFPVPGLTPGVLVPYYDLPGKISSVRFFYNQNNKIENIFTPINSYDDGFAGLEAVTSADDQVMIVSDPLFMLQIQAANFRCNLSPLSIVSASANTRNFDALNDKVLIHTTTQLNAWVLRQAAYTDGLLYVFDSAYSTYFSKERTYYNALDLYTRVLKQAVPWKKAFQRWVANASDTKIYNLLQDAKKTDQELYDKLVSCVKAKANVFKSTVFVVEKTKYLIKQNAVYHLCAEKEAQRLLPGILRVQKIVKHKGYHIYYFVLEGDGRLIRFKWRKAKRKSLQVQTLGKKLQEVLKAEQQPQKQIRLNKKQKSHLLPLALAFSSPEIIEGVDKCGWDGNVFQFPDTCIPVPAYNGVLKSSRDRFVCNDRIPGPAGSIKQTVRWFQHPPTSEQKKYLPFVWAVLISVIEAIIAPIHAKPQPLLLLGGKHIRSDYKVLLNAMGVFTKQLRCKDRADVRQFKWEHNYPLEVRQGYSVTTAVLRQWLLLEKSYSAVHYCEKRKLGHVMACLPNVRFIFPQLGKSQVTFCNQLPLGEFLLRFMRNTDLAAMTSWKKIQKAVFSLAVLYPEIPRQTITEAHKICHTATKAQVLTATAYLCRKNQPGARQIPMTPAEVQGSFYRYLGLLPSPEILPEKTILLPAKLIANCRTID